MFSFHRPKVYRSTQGCCICKAKSSSSRFTDSKKYETDFFKCFQLIESRQGEICNACVLLVKRFKRLPPGSDRHWSHVVDARIGPGLKSMSKCKKRKEEQNGTKKFSGQSGSSVQNIRNNEHFRKIVRKDKTKANLLKNKPPTPSDENSAPNSPSSTSDSDELRLSDDSGEIDVLSAMPIGSRSRRNQRKSSNPRKNHPISRAITIIDANFWSRVKACCGIIYENKDFNAVLIDVEHYGVNLCSIHDKKQIVPISYKEELSSVIKSLPPKKQHLHRQNMAESLQCTETIVQDAPIDYSIPSGLNKKIASQIVISYAQPQYNNVTGESSCSTNSPLNRTTKPIASKVTKKTVSRLLPKRGSNDVNSSKNLVKLCTDRNSIIHPNLNVPTCSPQGEHNENKNITNSANAEPVILNKYNDNSSDSGYEEIQQDTNHLNLIAAQSVIRATQPNTKPIHQQRLQAKRLPMAGTTDYKSQILNPPPERKLSVYVTKLNVLPVANNS